MKNYLNNNSILSDSNGKKKKFFFVLIPVLALMGIGGGVLAANITVGTGVVEFGQGTAEAIACDT
jgi:hypothetical protein